jgi:hypothetical protein
VEEKQAARDGASGTILKALSRQLDADINWPQDDPAILVRVVMPARDAGCAMEPGATRAGKGTASAMADGARTSLRQVLWGLVFVLVFPTLVIAAAGFYSNYSRRAAGHRPAHAGNGRALSLSLDREIDKSVLALRCSPDRPALPGASSTSSMTRPKERVLQSLTGSPCSSRKAKRFFKHLPALWGHAAQQQPAEVMRQVRENP